MYYIGDQILDFNTLKTYDASGRVIYYDGKDEVRQKLARAWREIDERFLNKNQKVVFKSPGIRAEGTVKGKMGYSYPRAVSIKTSKGKVLLRWCEDVVEENGKKVYKPVSQRIDMSKRILTLGENDIEEILWMFLFNPHVIRIGNPTGYTYMEDKEADAKKYAESETKNSVVAYWLYYESSPFYNDSARLDTIGLAWGVNIENQSIDYKKQQIAEAVKKYEKANDPELNMKAFDEVCRKMADGQDTRNVETMALIQRCIVRKIIKFDSEAFKWVILGEDGKSQIKTICKVPPQATSQSKLILRQHLLSNPDELQVLFSALGDEPHTTRLDRVLLTQPLPPPGEITEEHIRNEMKFNPDMKRLYQYFGGEWRNATKDRVVPMLIEKLILNKVEVPWELEVK